MNYKHRVFINALNSLSGGGKVYLQNLLKYFLPHHNLSLVILASKEHHSIFEKLPKTEQFDILYAPINPYKTFQRRFWERRNLRQLVKKSQANLYFSPGGPLPTYLDKNVGLISTFQNMLPYEPIEIARYPWSYDRLRLHLLRQDLNSSFQRARLVIFLSEYAKMAVDHALPYRTGKSVIIPHGITDIFYQQTMLPSHLSLPKKYVFYPSTIDYYKSQIPLIRAWEKLKKDHPYIPEKLVLAGGSNKRYSKLLMNEIQKRKLQNEVYFLGMLDHKHLPALYQHASLNLFASTCENCPNTLLEMMISKRPILCSHYGVMPEFGKDVVEYFDPYNLQESVNKIKVILNSTPNVEKINKMEELAHNYTWEEATYMTWDAISSL